MTFKFKNYIKQFSYIFVVLFLFVTASCEPEEDPIDTTKFNTVAAIKSLTVNIKFKDYTFNFEGTTDSIANITLPVGTAIPTTIGVKSVSLADGAYGVATGQVINVSGGVATLTVKAEDGKGIKNYKINLLTAQAGVSTIEHLSLKVNETDYVFKFKSVTTGGEVLRSDTTILLPLNVAIPPTVKVNAVTLSAGSEGVVADQVIPVVNSKAVFKISSTASGVTTTNDYTVTILETFKIENITYHGVQIGNQIWSVQNLATTKYNDGTPIRLVTKVADWKMMSDTAAVCCAYNFSASNVTNHGYLYNWRSVNSGKLAPAGWHIPTDEEWNTMQNWLIANGYNYNSTDLSSNNIGKSLSLGTTWATTSLNAAVGNTRVVSNNLSGFSARGSGAQPYMGVAPTTLTFGGYWWTSSESSATNAICRGLYFSFPNLLRIDSDKRTGYSIRLVKD